MSLLSVLRRLFESGPTVVLGKSRSEGRTGVPKGRSKAEVRLREHAEAILRAAVESAEPENLVVEELRRQARALPATTKIHVAGFGRAAAAMARGADAALGARIKEGVIIVPAGDEGGVPDRFDTFGGGEPLPDPAGVAGSRAIRQMAAELTADDLLLCLVSPGGSALLTVPPDGVPQEEIRELTRLLVDAGATGRDLNLVRRHVDMVKGGRLARAAAPARVMALVLSDRTGDPLDAVASGPLAPEKSSCADAVKALKRYGIWKRVPLAVRGYLDRGICGELPPAPGSSHACFERITSRIVGDGSRAARAACVAGEALGYETQLLTGRLDGEARRAGSFLAAAAQTLARKRGGDRRPLCLVTAGEIDPAAKRECPGAPNQELVLACALEIEPMEPVLVAAMSSSGTDGATEAAGAIATGTTLQRAAAAGIDCRQVVRTGEAHRAFESLDDLIVSGSTGTDVGDLQIVLLA
jgi:hydroxypyruvate reductase